MTPATHTVKEHPAIYDAMKRGVKKFNVQKDDRAYQTGDYLTVTCFDPDAPSAPPTPNDKSRLPMTFNITFVLRGGQYGVEAGYVVLALEALPKAGGI